MFKHLEGCTGGTPETTAQGDGEIIRCPECGATEPVAEHEEVVVIESTHQSEGVS